MDTPRFSVIVPVYNTEAYLDDCLDSLIGQTCADWEAVCVNDGSTDESLAVLRRRAAADSRIRVIDRANGGVSAARNAGIDAARGEFVSFLDSDDRLAPGALARVVEEIDRTGADVVTYGAYFVPDSAATPWMRLKLSPRDVVYRGFSTDLLFKEQSMPYIRFAARRELLDRRGIRFPEGLKLAEDMVVLFSIYLNAGVSALISDKLYEYRMEREGQVTGDSNVDVEMRTRSHLPAIELMFRAWRERFPEGEHAGAVIAWSIEFVLYGLLCLNAPRRAELLPEYARIFREVWGDLDISALGLAPYELAMVSAALDGSGPGDMRARVLRFKYTVGRYGFKAIIGKVLGMN